MVDIIEDRCYIKTKKYRYSIYGGDFVSKKALEQIPYHKNVIAESEKMIETLNPQYAENKAQAKSILDLQARQDQQDKKLDSILEVLNRIAPKA